MARGNVRVSITGDASGLGRATKKAETDLSHLQEHAKGQLTALRRSVLSAGAAFATFEGVKTAVDSVEMLTKSTIRLNAATGLSVKEASAFAAVAESRNIDQKKLGQTFAVLSKNSIAAATGSKTAEAAFKALGVPLATLKSGNFDKVFMSVADGMHNMKGGTDKTTIAAKLFGRSWQDLIPLLQGGSKEIRENLALADKYGATLGVKNVKQLHEFIQKQHESQLAMLGLNVAIGTELAPTLTRMLGTFSKFIGQMRDGTGAGGKFADTLKAIAEQVKPILVFFKDHPKLIAIAVAGWATYKAAAIAAAIAATGATGGLTAAFTAAFVAGYEFGKHWNEIWAGVKSVTEDTVNWVIKKINALIGAYNSIPLLPNVGKVGGVDLHTQTVQSTLPASATANSKSPSTAGGKYTKDGLMRLWIAAGGPRDKADQAAAIALAESNQGDPNARNSIGATGLWQIYNGPNTSMSLKDPWKNAQAAVAKYKASLKTKGDGFLPWTTYTGADTGPGGTAGPKTYMNFLDDANAAAAKKTKPKTQSEILAAHLDKAQGVFDTISSRGDTGVYSTATADHQMLKYTLKALKGRYGKLSLSGRLAVLKQRRDAQANIAQRSADRKQAAKDSAAGLLAGLDERNQQNSDAASALLDYRLSYAGTPFSDAALTMAQVDTPGDTSDDLAIDKGRLGVSQDYYAQAKASGDQAGIVTWGKAVMDNTQAIADLTQATEQNTQQQLDAERAAKEDFQRLYNTSQAQYGTWVKGIADAMSGQIGGKAGLGSMTPSFAGSGARY